MDSFSGHNDIIECIAINPDGNLIATGSSDNSIKIWEIVWINIKKFV